MHGYKIECIWVNASMRKSLQCLLIVLECAYECEAIHGTGRHIIYMYAYFSRYFIPLTTNDKQQTTNIRQPVNQSTCQPAYLSFVSYLQLCKSSRQDNDTVLGDKKMEPTCIKQYLRVAVSSFINSLSTGR
ncbi:unnamed protein product [Ceratitis capitata]|uniref:(Mediterranean fruit fly) hypothetical protein n=1 Tax=Ceratitis capitata TaxID=7213 RepID=A0A811UZ25_CERCA|nr:unnamed protein product [Ceratitis capitata]